MKNWLLVIFFFWIAACSSTPSFNDYYSINDQFSSSIGQKKAKLKALKEYRKNGGRINLEMLTTYFQFDPKDISRIAGNQSNVEIPFNNKNYARMVLFLSRDVPEVPKKNSTLVDSIIDFLTDRALNSANEQVESGSSGAITLDSSKDSPFILLNLGLYSSKLAKGSYSRPQFSADGISNLIEADEFQDLLSDADYDLDDLGFSDLDLDELKQNGYLAGEEIAASPAIPVADPKPEKAKTKKGKK